MNNQVILIKIRQRLNKIARNDYDNIEHWQIIEAFHKAQVDWCRRNLHGINQLREGDEQSNRRIDDMQVLLKTIPCTVLKMDLHYETQELPDNYLQWKRISAQGVSECCDNKRNLIVYLAEEGNVDVLLNDYNKRPSFDWGETFATIKNKRVCIYTNNEFELDKVSLTYYTQPKLIEIAGVMNPYTGIVATVDVESDFKDDLIELFIEEAVKILGGDLEMFNRQQMSSQTVEANN